MEKLINKLLKEEYFKLYNAPKFESVVLNKLSEILGSKLESPEEDEYLEESMAGKDFYNSLTAKGYEKDELFDVKIPVELLTDRKRKKSRQIDVMTKVPIDVTMLDDFIEEFKKAKETNAELYQKYQVWANWYDSFHNLIFGSLPETDACLFLAAAAFASVNTTLDVNIQEAAKLYKAVKADWGKSNASRKALAFVANNVNSIEKEGNLDILKKLADSNSSYAALLVPKRDVTDPNGKQVREITVSQAKLTNYNNFIKYFIRRNGRLTRQQIMNDLKTGALTIGGTKVYSFFVNLIDPNFEWVSVEGDESAKIQPATIDRWMIRIFFTRPLRNLVDELQEADVVVEDIDAQEVFISQAIKYLFDKDKVRSNIVKIMNEHLIEHKLNLKAQQLQAFGWVKIREESGAPSADFSSFEDVVQFTKKISDRIDQINPELNFIKNHGEDIKDEAKDVLSAINLLAKMPRFNVKDEQEIERVMKNWREFNPEHELDKGKQPEVSLSIKKGASATKDKFLLTPIEAEAGIWETPIKLGKEILTTVRGVSRGNVIKVAKDWINQHKPFD